MDRLRNLISFCVVIALFAGCDDKSVPQTAARRFEGVKTDNAAAAYKTFCERGYPGGPGQGHKLPTLPERPLPVASATPAAKANAWRWINFWATWCTPCMEEIPLLGRWNESLAKDGVSIGLELWSVDDDQAALAAWLKKPAPGRVRWLKTFDDLGPVLEGLGVARASALPVHVLVDPNGAVRCVRVGAVHDEDYGAIKAILVSG